MRKGFSVAYTGGPGGPMESKNFSSSKEQHLLTIQQESEGITMMKSLTPKFFCALLSGIVVYGVLLAAPVQGQTLENPSLFPFPLVPSPTLVNLTPRGASIAAGNARCPHQPYFFYVGGNPDAFNGPADRAYPSLDLRTFMSTPPSVQGIVNYDVPMNNGRFGDSFNLQNTRSVCYAVIQFRAKHTGAIPGDSLTIGHVGSGGAPFTVAAEVINPGNPGPSIIQTYAFTTTGLDILSHQITGFYLDKTPLDSILDVELQDATEIDFIKLWLWYGPNCGAFNPPTC